MIELATEFRWQDKRLDMPMERILLTEKWGYDAVFTCAGVGAESLVTAGYLAAHVRMLAAGKGETQMIAGQTALEGRKWEEALDAVPDDYIDDGWLVGPVARIAERVKPWLDCGLTGLVMRYGPPLVFEKIVEPVEVYHAITKVAGKEPRAI